jgi:hypothetical protein
MLSKKKPSLTTRKQHHPHAPCRALFCSAPGFSL